MEVLYDDTMASDGVMNGIKQIRKIAGEQTFVAGMAATIEDIKELSEKLGQDFSLSD